MWFHSLLPRDDQASGAVVAPVGATGDVDDLRKAIAIADDATPTDKHPVPAKANLEEPAGQPLSGHRRNLVANAGVAPESEVLIDAGWYPTDHKACRLAPDPTAEAFSPLRSPMVIRPSHRGGRPGRSVDGTCGHC